MKTHSGIRVLPRRLHKPCRAGLVPQAYAAGRWVGLNGNDPLLGHGWIGNKPSGRHLIVPFFLNRSGYGKNGLYPSQKCSFCPRHGEAFVAFLLHGVAEVWCEPGGIMGKRREKSVIAVLAPNPRIAWILRVRRESAHGL